VTTVSRLVAGARDRRVLLAVLASLVGVLVALSVLVPSVFPVLTDPVAVRTLVRGFGVWAPVAFVVLQAAQVVLAPVPGHVFGLASGYLFGVVAGTAYGLVGAAIGTYLAVVLARRLGRPFVVRLVPDESIERFDEIARERGLLALLLVFLIPGVPDDAACLVAGLTDLDVRKVVAVSVVGRFPGFVLTNLAGAGVAAGDYRTVAIVVALLVGIAMLAYWQRARLDRWLAG